MIRYADDSTAPLVRQMWKICFEDDDEYIDIYFAHKYHNENTLIYFEDEAPVASLQMLPYTITFYKQPIPFYYLAGLCTLPEYRKRGYMDRLIHKAHIEIENRGIALSILIPAEDWLYGFYENYGYTQVFKKDDNQIPLNQILNSSADLISAYNTFNGIYKSKDFCIQKTFEDFTTIVEEYKYDNCPQKTNLSGMAHIIMPLPLLKLFAAKNKHLTLNLKLEDNNIYTISNGQVDIDNKSNANIYINTALLCRLLFGFETDQLENKELAQIFPVHHPIMNLMLE